MQGIVCLHVRMTSIGFCCAGKKSRTTWGNIPKNKRENIHTLITGDHLSTFEDSVCWILLKMQKNSSQNGETFKKKKTYPSNAGGHTPIWACCPSDLTGGRLAGGVEKEQLKVVCLGEKKMRTDGLNSGRVPVVCLGEGRSVCIRDLGGVYLCIYMYVSS